MTSSTESRTIPPALPRHLRQPGEDGYRTPVIEDPEHPAHHRHRNVRSARSSSSQALNSPGNGLLEMSSLSPGQTPHSEKNQPSHEGDRCYLPEGFPKNLSWSQRLKHTTWAYFTVTMATGGIANVVAAVPTSYRFNGLEVIGTIFFLLNLVFYIAIWIMIGLRFYFHPRTFKSSFTHPTESLFAPATVVSFGTILINIVQYGLDDAGPWLSKAAYALFWLNAVLAITLSVSIYLILWSTQYFSVANMTPIWIFPAYPLLIVGPFAGVLSSKMSTQAENLTIIIAGFTVQGVGFLVAFSIYAAFVYRLMTQKLPQESLRPGMFVSVGPSGFTVAGTINMAANIRSALPKNYMDAGDSELTAQIIQVVANWICLWLWGLAVWFFLIAVGAHYSCVRGNMSFAMNWFSFIFPNTALITATFAVAKAFNSPAINIIGSVMTCLLILAWFFVVFMMFRAIYLKQILWPQKGEDRDEGGFHSEDAESLSISAESPQP
ncbi:hypothetical protein GJ744_008294 [Endocarpon pusillum]|uniref:Malic acid transport protein n=1 Tax=Endocarpon pusillum TaxID=364733 RepID=A0A8H7AJD6_9EURO|nr:hypothetical protein GJ744_008294 [Endocarpon pusillum]